MFLKLLKVILFLTLPITILAARAESLSYSGRLVNANGSAVKGPVHLKFDLAYTNNLSAILCTHENSNVNLINGVFHAKLDFVCPSSNLKRVLEGIPSNSSIAIRVTDLSQTPAKAYSYQALHSVPNSIMSEMSKQLVQMGAKKGQVLTWNGTQWAPEDGASPEATGTISNLTFGDGLYGGTITESGVVGIDDGGVTAQKINQMGAVEGEVLTWTSTGWAPRKESDPHTLGFARKDALAIPIPDNCGSDEKLQYVVALQTFVCEKIFFKTSDIQAAAVGNLIDKDETKMAPSQKAVFDALAGKEDKITSSSEVTMKSLRLTNDGTSWVDVKVPDSSGNYEFTLPAGAGANGQYLKNTGGGVLVWDTPSVESANIAAGSISDTHISSISTSKITGLDGQLGDINSGLSTVTTGLNTVTTGLSTVNTEMSTLTTGLNTVNTSLTNVESDVAAIKSDYLKKDGSVSLSGDLNLDSHKLTNVADPVNPQDAATMKYVDDEIAAKSYWSKAGTELSYLDGDVNFGQKLRLKSSETNVIELKAPDDLNGIVTFTLPKEHGASGQFLKTDASGNLSWGDVTGGTITEINSIAPLSGSGAAGGVALSLNYDNVTLGLVGADLTVKDGGITNSKISAGANIDWSKINKTGATASDVGAVPTTRTITPGTGLLGGGDLSTDRSLSVNVGTNAGQIIQVEPDGKLPVIDGSNLTNLTWSQIVSSTLPEITPGVGLTSTGSLASGQTLNVDVGTGANQIVRLDGNAKLPAVDGSQLTNLGTNFGKWSDGTGGIHYSGGSVGVGTTSPNALMHVKGSSTALSGTVDITAGTSTVSGTGTAFTTELTVGDFITISGETFQVGTISNDSSLSLNGTHVAGASGASASKNTDLLLVQDQAGTTKFKIDSSGKASLGATTQEKLTVDGVVALKESSTPSDSAGFGKLYVKDNKKLYFKGEGAAEVDLTSGGSGVLADDSVNTSHIQDNSITLDKVDFSSATSGLGMPSMTKAQRDAMASPSEGMMIFNADSKSLNVYSNGKWKDLNTEISTNGFVPGFTQVESARHHSCAVMTDKTVRCWGHGGSGILGNNNTADQNTPVTVYKENGSPLSDIVQVSTDWDHNCAVATNGSVWCWGNNGQYDLGDGTATSKNTAVEIYGAAGAVKVEAGVDMSCASYADGSMKCWGQGASYGLGNGTTATKTTPTPVTVMNNVRDFDIGYHNTCAINNDDELYCWGYGLSGQIGNGSTANVSTAVLVMVDVKSVNTSMLNYYHSTNGHYYYGSTCAVKNDGTIWCWGSGAYGRNGDGTTTDRSSPVQVYRDDNRDGISDGPLTNVVKVKTTGWNTCAITSDTQLWCWGYNGYNRLGDGTSVDRSVYAIKVPGVGGEGLLTGVVDFDISTYFTYGLIAVLNNGKAVAWGGGSSGFLGNGASLQAPYPTYVRNEGTGGSSFVEGSVAEGHLMNNSVTNEKIADGSITLNKLDFSSTSMALPVPYMSTAERNAITPSKNGFMIINSETFEINYMANGVWKAGAGGGGAPAPNSVENQHINNGAVTADKIDLSGTNNALVFTNMTTDQRNALATPTDGMIVYNTDTDQLNVYGNGGWKNVIDKLPSEGPDAMFTHVTSGRYHACTIMSDKTVRCWGDNSGGKLGDNTQTHRYFPKNVYTSTGEPLSNVIQIDSTRDFTCAATANGDVYCWGIGDNGENGDGTTGNNLTAKKIPTINGAIMVKTAMDYACALFPAGNMKCWGYNGEGHLGDGTTTQRLTPVDTIAINNVRDMDFGRNHSCVVKKDNTLWCWGNNNYGQLGNGTDTSSITPVLIATNIKTVNAGMHWYDNGTSYWYGQTCAIKLDGALYCWGLNNYGQLGDGTTTTRTTPVPVLKDINRDGTSDGFMTGVKKAVTSGRNSCALMNDKTVWCTGENDWNELGDGTNVDRSMFVQVPGINGEGVLENVADISITGRWAGTIHAVLESGELVAWGYNGNGQLGDDSTIQRSTPKYIFDREGNGSNKLVDDSIATAHISDDAITTEKVQDRAITIDKVDFASSTKGLKIPYMTTAERDAVSPIENGQIIVNSDTFEFNFVANGTWKTGGGAGGPLSPNGVEGMHINSGAVTTDKIDLTDPTKALTFTNVTTTERDTIANPKEGMIVYNKDTNQINVFNGSGWEGITDQAGLAPDPLFTAVTSGAYHGCSIMTDKTVRCWGENTSGKLGDNTTAHRYYPMLVYKQDGSPLNNIVQINSQYFHTCALDTEGAVWCWGENASSKLGDGTTAASSVAKKVPGILGAVKVEISNESSCALLSDKTLKCWGYNGHYQLGDGTTTVRSTPVPNIQITDVRDVSMGRYHICAIKTNDELYCWGYNGNGEVGNGTVVTPTSPALITTNVKSVNAGGQISYGSTCAIKNDETLWCWGYNAQGQLGDGTTTQRNAPTQALMDIDKNNVSDGAITGVKKVVSGGRVTCAIRNDSSLWCAGGNAHYELGDGTTTVRYHFVPIPGVGGVGTLTDVVDVHVSLRVESTIHAVLGNGKMVAWGYNGNGQIGDSSTTNSLYPKYIQDREGGSSNQLIDQSIATAHLKDLSITNDKIKNETITDNKLSGLPTGCANGQILKTNGFGGFYCANPPDGHSLDSADGSVIDAIYANNNGHIGIGTTNPAAKLDVSGEVKFGNTSSACSLATEGQQRYNIGTKSMEFCNGIAWTPYGTGNVLAGSTCGWSHTNPGSAGIYAGQVTKTVLCAGHDPSVSCPGGYDQLTRCDDNGSNCGHMIYYCVKN